MSAAILRVFLRCCTSRYDGSRVAEKSIPTDPAGKYPYCDQPSNVELADQIVTKPLTADNNDADLKAELISMITTEGWQDELATKVLAAVQCAIEMGKEMGPAMSSAYEKAEKGVQGISEWAQENPEMAALIVTLIALGILAIMMPWLMVWLGFAEEGIIEASWAAFWQATYRGFVPKRSLFAYLQSLGTRISWKWPGWNT
ncbi:Hypothetical protein D9617_55g071580 [Elsinoe fawcettii]|nr:Hypothetical protein D9617_55g071580 [Elsinoe fawcettii]